MITVPEVVEEIIINSPYLEKALSDGIINYSGLSRKIKPEIREKLLKNVQDGAIIMALKRLSKKIKTKLSYKKLLKSNCDFIVRSNLVEYVISNTDFMVEKHREILSVIQENKSHFMTITEGVFETTIIVSNDLSKEIEKILKIEKLILKIINLSSITIRLPKENVYTQGLYYFFLKTLAWSGINIIEVVSTYTEFTIILESKEVDRAFSGLKKSLS